MVKAAPIAAGSTHPSQSATAVTVTVIERDTPSPTPEVIAGASVTGMVVFLLFCFYCYERWKKRRNARRTRDKDTAFETAARIGVERYKLAAAKNVAAQDGRTT
jgi:hypothetical protein